MAEPAGKRATYADLAAVPDRYVAEIIRGELRTHPRPAPAHALAASRLGMRLGRSFDEGDDGPGGWWILDEPELHLPDGDVLVPDLAGWRLERMPELPETAHFELAPDWVCEVLSASTEAEDRAEKMPAYASFGVRHLWLVDPRPRTLEVFRLEREKWLLVGTHRDEELVRAEPFEAVELPLAALWRRPAGAR